MAHIEAAIKSSRLNLVAKTDNLDYVKKLDQNTWILVTKGWKLIAPNQVSVDLTLREYKLLNQLFLSPGEVICKNHLVEDIIGKNIYNSYEKLNKIISELRKKILANVNLALPIKTIHTIGYAFNSEAVIDG
jgi:DNA-binding response OmpR family regulator